MKLFSLFIMDMENFKCQEDCNVHGYYTCQWQIYGNDSVEYGWCDNGKYCGCAVKCTKGPHKGETCFGTCNVGWCCTKDKKSTCPGGENDPHYGIYREGLCESENTEEKTEKSENIENTENTEKAGCAIAVSNLWLCFSALLIIA